MFAGSASANASECPAPSFSVIAGSALQKTRRISEEATNSLNAEDVSTEWATPASAWEATAASLNG